VVEAVEAVQSNLPELLDLTNAAKDLFKPNKRGLIGCLATVLQQEIQRFNRLLKQINDSIENIRNAIQGKIAMSPDLDSMFLSILNKQVP
jgi:hypothetical protein